MFSRIPRLAAAAAVAILPLTTASAHAASAPQTGWVRLAHLSPNTPAVDVYLYPYGNSAAQLVLKHVAYGDASPYESLVPGLYLVAMRAAGAGSTTSPVISTDVTVAAGKAYTVAGLGPASALTLTVLDDQLGTPGGRASVRVIEASLRDPTVTVSDGSGVIANNLRFPTVTAYQTVDAGDWSLHVATDTAATTSRLTLASNGTYTFAVLDGAGDAPRVLNLTDAAGSSTVPKGGVSTGFGGTAQAGTSTTTEVLWATLFALGLGGVLLAAKRLRHG